MRAIRLETILHAIEIASIRSVAAQPSKYAHNKSRPHDCKCTAIGPAKAMLHLAIRGGEIGLSENDIAQQSANEKAAGGCRTGCAEWWHAQGGWQHTRGPARR